MHDLQFAAFLVILEPAAQNDLLAIGELDHKIIAHPPVIGDLAGRRIKPDLRDRPRIKRRCSTLEDHFLRKRMIG